MNNTILALEVLWKIAGNFLFNPTAAGRLGFEASESLIDQSNPISMP